MHLRSSAGPVSVPPNCHNITHSSHERTVGSAAAVNGSSVPPSPQRQQECSSPAALPSPEARWRTDRAVGGEEANSEAKRGRRRKRRVGKRCRETDREEVRPVSHHQTWRQTERQSMMIQCKIRSKFKEEVVIFYGLYTLFLSLHSHSSAQLIVSCIQLQ